MKNLILVLFSILFTGCSQPDPPEISEHIKKLDSLRVYPTDMSPEKEIDLISEQTFGSSDEVMMGRLGSMGIDYSGRVFIEDIDKKYIHIFGHDGRYLTNIGREGSGPGDFRTIHIMRITLNQLYVYDALMMRISIFSLDSLSLSHTQNMTPKNKSRIEEIADHRISQLLQINSDIYLAGFVPTIRSNPDSPGFNADSLYRLYYLLDSNGRFISDKIFEQRYKKYLIASVDNEYRSTAFEFMGRPLLALSNDRCIFSAWSTDFLIKERDSTGNYIRAIFYPVQKRKFTKEEALDKYDMKYHQGLIRNASEDLPEFWPVLESMYIDDENRIWLSTIIDDQEVYEWWVLKTSGELLARFTWPRNRSIEEVKDGYLYTKETDEETELQEIVRYRIVMN